MTANFREQLIGKRLVVKVGSALVTKGGQGVDFDAIASWVVQITTLRALGCEVVLVSSGAIAEGLKRLNWKTRPKQLNQLQAAAAVGQMGLVQAYEQFFSAQHIKTAQVLLTHADLANRERYLNARSTLQCLLAYGVVPIINENDTVVTDEIRFGDNDTLAALVTNLIEADSLFILTDQVGLFNKDPRKFADAELLSEVFADNPDLVKMAGGAGSSVGTGGMLTKVLAAQRAARSGADTYIASGHENLVLERLVQGERVGTVLKSSMTRLAARKQWLADHLKLKGSLQIDEGAVQALVSKKSSLLAVGVMSCVGTFYRGDVVACVAPNGQEVARGLVNYSSLEIAKIAGVTSAEIESILGYQDEPELIHRDNLVIN